MLPFFVNSLSVNSQLILPCLTNREPDSVCVFFPSENNTSLPFEDSTYFFVFELTLSSVIVLEKLCEEEELKEEERLNEVIKENLKKIKIEGKE